MNTLKYKGFVGSVSFSERDNLFFGKIEGIDSLVNFEGDCVAELKQSFEDAVNDYLVYCEDNQLEPRKSHTGASDDRILQFV